ncbi:MAG: hypothetical protein J6U64_05375 [Alphaproteobacteria bacterium]|nr:hypothetical protein [Alphaproteobacteria bacterium]
MKKPKKFSAEGYDALIIDCLCQRFSLSEEVGKALLYDVEWEDGFGALSEKAIRKIVEAMKTGMTYDMACQEAGYHHSHKETVHRDFLPYYGEILEQSCIGQKDNPTTPEERYGKIANATVHVALNQVRQVVNELIRHYGQPFDISIEYARDLNASAEERQKMTKNRDDNEAENERIKKELFEKTGRSDWTHRDIEKYKIWKNMGVPKGESALNCRECPYTGDKVSVSDLLNGNRFQIEHIIPFSLSLDNSYANRVIASTDANYAKGNRTPYDAFHKDEFAPRITWADIQKRIKKLPLEQQWRFGKDAMKKFEEKEGPIARVI